MEQIQHFLRRNLKLFRKMNKMTQEQLAEQSCISATYIAEIEIGRKCPSLKTLVKLANSLDVDVHRLLENPDTTNSDHIRRFSGELMNGFERLLLETGKNY